MIPIEVIQRLRNEFAQERWYTEDITINPLQHLVTLHFERETYIVARFTLISNAQDFRDILNDNIGLEEPILILCNKIEELREIVNS